MCKISKEKLIDKTKQFKRVNKHVDHFIIMYLENNLVLPYIGLYCFY